MNYKPLELGYEGTPACPDKFTDESTLICPGSTRVIIQIAGEHSAIVQLGIMPQGRGTGKGAVVWQQEDPYNPIAASLARRVDAVRVRNYKAGAEAKVFINVA